MICYVVLVCGCKPTFEKTIEAYLNENLKDPKSYECIELGEPKKYTPMARGIEWMLEEKKQGRLHPDSLATHLEKIKVNFEANGTDPYKLLGWEIAHKYRAKNSFGAYELCEVSYILSEDQTEIIEIRQK